MPSVPEFEGIETFPGRVLHSHDFKHHEEFKNQTVLLIGGSFSAEDLALHCLKGKAKEVLISCRKPMDTLWKKPVVLLPLLSYIEGSSVHFPDGTVKEVDSIIFCTGYKHHFPFLPDDLRLHNITQLFFLPELYKGIFWKSNPSVMYMGAMNMAYTNRLLEAQASWIVKHLTGNLEVPNSKERAKNITEWVVKWVLQNWGKYQGFKSPTFRCSKINDVRSILEFQTDYILDLVKDSGHPYDLNLLEMLYEIYIHKKTDPKTYRDQCFTSVYTGIRSVEPKIPNMKIQDDSIEAYLQSGRVKES